MPDHDNAGGRQQQPAADLDLFHRTAAQSAPSGQTQGADGGTTGDVVSVAQALRRHCVDLDARLSPPGAAHVNAHLTPEIVQAHASLVGLLDDEAQRVPPAALVALPLAWASLSGVALKLNGADQASAHAFAVELAARMATRGVTTGGNLPGSTTSSEAENPETRLRASSAALVAVADGLRARMDYDAPRPQVERLVHATAPVLVAHLRDLKAIATGAKDQHGLHPGALDAATEAIESLSMRSRQLALRQVPAGLDDVFMALDQALLAAGGDAERFHVRYYADRNASDFDDDREHRDENAPTGRVLAERIQHWFEAGTVVQTFLTTEASRLIDEPAVTPPPSALEAAVEYVVRSLIGMIPGYLSQLVDGGLKRVLAGPAAASEPVKGPASVTSDLPAPGPERGAHGTHDVVKNIAAAVQPMLLRAPTRDAQKAMGKLVQKDKASDPAGAPLPRKPGQEKAPSSKGGPLSSSFIAMLNDEALADLQARIEALGGLQTALALAAPDELERFWGGLMANSAHVIQQMRTDLVTRWATALSMATNGVDQAGTVDELGGSLENASKNPGSVVVDVRVHTNDVFAGPDATLERPMRPRGEARVETLKATIAGLGETALWYLRDANQPISQLKMNRIYDVEAVGADGALYRVGRFDINGDGVLDLDGASVAPGRLAQIALGQAVTADQTYGLSDPTLARHGAQLIIAGVTATSADLKPR